MQTRSCAAALVGLALLCALGCRQFDPPSRSLLARPQMSPDSVALDIVFVQYPVSHAEAGESIWRELDEQTLPVELRRRLAQNGLRAGLSGGQLPLALERLLGEPLLVPDDDPEEGINDFLPKDVNVRKRHLQLRAARRSEIVASGIYEQWPLLLRREGEVTGRTLRSAQGVFALQIQPQGDGRVLVELVPEVHHGAPKRQYTVNEGAWVLESGRAREVFDAMRIEAVLSPGEMLVVGQACERPGSLGHRFFTLDDTPSGVAAERLLLIRVAQTQYDDRFAAPL